MEWPHRPGSGRAGPVPAALLLFGLALGLRLAASLWWRFDGLYGQDPYAYYRQAVAITETLPHGQPPPADFFWPNGYPLLVAGLMALVGRTALAGQLAALLAGSLLPPLLYLLGRDLERAARPAVPAAPAGRAGLLAGLMAAVAGQPILSSVVVMADMPALLWATLAAWATVRADHRSPGWFFLAGIALALAIITRWLYVLLAPALVLYVLLGAPCWFRRPGRALWPPLLAGLGGAALLAPQLWLSLHRPAGLLHSWLTGWQPANFLARQFENVDGRFSYALPNVLFYAQPAGHPAYLFPLLGLAAAWGLWRLAGDRRWPVLALLLGWAGPVYLFLAGIPYQNFRFGLSLYPPLALLAGYGLADLWRRAARPPGWPSGTPWLGRGLTTLTVLSFLGALLWAYPMLDSFLTAQNESKAIARRVADLVPADATLLAFGLTLTLQHYTPLPVVELFHEDPASLAGRLARPGPVYLLLDPANVERQWPGRAPQVNYAWLRQRCRLEQVAVFAPYVLWRLGDGPGCRVSMGLIDRGGSLANSDQAQFPGAMAANVMTR